MFYNDFITLNFSLDTTIIICVSKSTNSDKIEILADKLLDDDHCFDKSR